MPHSRVVNSPRHHLSTTISERWVLARNRRCSGYSPDWTDEPTIHAAIVETVNVEPEHRQQGNFRSFLAELCANPRFDLVVIEAVQNPILAEALLRWGWDCDPAVMDFYKHK